MDFVTEIEGNVVPIEVKSGTNVKAKSLQTFRDKYRSKLSIRYSMKPLEYNNGLLNIPVYLAGLGENYIEKYMGK